MFWKKREFKDLQKVWYKHLEEFGFEDIEDGDRLKQNAPNSYRQAPELQRQSKLEYYSLLSRYITEKAPEFDDGIDYFVMHKLALGWKYRQICKTLEDLGNSRHRLTIMYIKRKYENRWGIRAWTPNQLTSARKKKKS